MKKLICFLTWLPLTGWLSTVSGQVQQELDQYNRERLSINKTGMAILASWSMANVIGGGTGYFTAREGEARYFHQMNGMWGLVNLAIGGAGWLGALRDHKTYDFEQSLKNQQGHEKVFILNAALDAVYITAGLLLVQNGKADPKRAGRYRGWGNSLMVQGGGLLIFDAVMFVVHNHHGKNKLLPIIRRANFSWNENGIGLQYRF